MDSSDTRRLEGRNPPGKIRSLGDQAIQEAGGIASSDYLSALDQPDASRQRHVDLIQRPPDPSSQRCPLQ